jgi:hypothetical protein
VRRIALIVAAAAALLAPGAARAAYDQESMLQDDNLLLYSSPATVGATLDTLKALGVDRVRLTVKWSVIAPQPNATQRPGFDANDPAAYPAGVWDRYDTVVRAAQDRGIGVDFNLTAPAPDWATTNAPKPTERNIFNPSPAEFQAFVHAVGTRYSGTYTPTTTTTSGGGGGIGGLLGGGRSTTTTTPAAGGPLPRVSYWSVWNEPNQPGWLMPQSAQTNGKWVDEAPRLYRALLDAAFASLFATGHGQDTILIGETAPQGSADPGLALGIFPLKFLRELYCVDKKLHPLRGKLAAALGCPTGGTAKAFADAHPDLFAATGLAHHPYSLFFPPDFKALDPDSVGVADLSVLERTLDKIFRAYGQSRRLPIYLTEYGYQTKPPDPTGVSTRKQQSYLNQADFMTFQDPRVKALSQFQLQDDLPNQNVAKNSRFYWSTFQSGLEYHGGKHKASFAAYRLPIWLPRTRGSVLRVWGLVRPAANGARQTVQIAYRPAHGRSWRTLRTLKVSSPRGSFLTRVNVPRGRGLVRIGWNGTNSRAVAVSR